MTAAQTSRKRRRRSGIGSARRVAVFDERLALDVLEHEVRRAVRRGPAVEQAGDVGMLERGRDLPLAPEALQRELARHAGPDELDGDLLLELVVGAAGEVDHAHAALPELGEELVGADAIADAPARASDLERRERRGPPSA